MKIVILSITLITLFYSTLCFAQNEYPFNESSGGNGIRAYWYNVPQDSVKMEIFNQNFQFQSSLQIYGKTPGDSFQVHAAVYSKSGEKIYVGDFDLIKGQAKKSFSAQFNGNFFSLECPVEYLTENPDRIIVTVKSADDEITQEIKCRYQRLFGHVSDYDGKPFEGIVSISPEAFISGTAIKCDSSGNYDIEVPERTYNSVICFAGSYGISTLEVWAWHIIMDSEQRLDFTVGTGEVYNLNVWPNNGGPNTYFISFRPMVLPFTQNTNITELLENIPKYPITINNDEFQVEGETFDLEPEDINVWINGKEVQIISLQKYFETGKNKAQISYIAQVSREGLSRTGKQTVKVEFETDIEKDGKKVRRSSMGYYQLNLNFTGLSYFN
ncbi:MAG: hypothetical protein HOC71_12755 [Candidatus Latescibacteria bacterium]|jgi:hypothetical protein|nr:hypothetical protein [Candidatus Latescibacterota bacterium]